MILFLNPQAGGATAAPRFEQLRPALERGPLRGGYTRVTCAGELSRRLLTERGEATLVAAGGDGTVNLALEALLSLPERLRGRWTLGAIGLGSSNDFHKPQRVLLGGRPVRLDSARAEARDVGQVDFLDPQGRPQRCHFLLNASVGVVAEANQRFNTGDAVLRSLKPRWTAGAIGYAALRALLTAHDLEARVALDGVRSAAPLTNLHVLLSPCIAGGLRYDLEASPQAGSFAVALCERQGRLSRLRTILALSRGRFRGLPGTRSGRAWRVEIDVAAPVALETDGEVRLASAIRIQLLRKAVSVCR